ncbi:MBL fold metallo-hydrolase, partial [Halobium palmae]
MSVTDGVHAIRLEYDFDDRTMVIHPTAVETDRGLVLVDAGLPGAVDQLESALDDAGHDLSDVRLLLFTHQFGDLVGGLDDHADVDGFD